MKIESNITRELILNRIKTINQDIDMQNNLLNSNSANIAEFKEFHICEIEGLKRTLSFWEQILITTELIEL